MKKIIGFLISLTMSACLLVGATACGGAFANHNGDDVNYADSEWLKLPYTTSGGSGDGYV